MSRTPDEIWQAGPHSAYQHPPPEWVPGDPLGEHPMVRKIVVWLMCMTALVCALWLLLGWATANATPSMACAKHAKVVADLDKRYDEQPIAFGMHSNGMFMQIFASEKRRTWTIVLTQPSGLSCLIGAGRGFEQLPWPVEEAAS